MTSYALVARIGNERLNGGEGADRDALLLPAASSVSGSDDAAAVHVSRHRRRRRRWRRWHEAAR